MKDRDQLILLPFLDKLEREISDKYNSSTADAGYESEEKIILSVLQVKHFLYKGLYHKVYETLKAATDVN